MGFFPHTHEEAKQQPFLKTLPPPPPPPPPPHTHTHTVSVITAHLPRSEVGAQHINSRRYFHLPKHPKTTQWGETGVRYGNKHTTSENVITGQNARDHNLPMSRLRVNVKVTPPGASAQTPRRGFLVGKGGGGGDTLRDNQLCKPT